MAEVMGVAATVQRGVERMRQN